MTELICLSITVLTLFVLSLFFALKRINGFTVGKDIAFIAVTELIYTYASSTYPPTYIRYRFYTENGKHYFYHEKRESRSWPPKKEDITLSASTELSEEEWQQFLKYIENGKVKKPTKNINSGDSGPWIYLHWNGDRSKYRFFTFTSINTKKEFEDFCTKLEITK